MYVPDHFNISDREEMLSFLEHNNFGQLISIENKQLTASHLPFLVDADLSRMTCHLARQNSQWQQLGQQRVLITFQGPHDYISPSWYVNPGVPTWNYQALHVYGRCRVFDDADELAAVVEALSALHELAFTSPWQPDYRQAMLKAIVGVEITIDEIQCKYKLSQNRPAADQQAVIDKLDQPGSAALARAMRKTLL